MRKAEAVRGVEPLTGLHVSHVRRLFRHFEDVGSLPALWERSFEEILGVFKTPESVIKAFRVFDRDSNGLIDSRELLGALAIMSTGHLTERITLVFDIFDLGGDKDMGFDECFFMIRQTMVGLRKMVGVHAPPEKVVQNMVRQVWRVARKHREDRINQSDWYAWWSGDGSCRNGLKIFVWNAEEQRGLPTPDQYNNMDYTKSAADSQLDNTPTASPRGPQSPRPGSRQDGRISPPPMLGGGFVDVQAGIRRKCYVAQMDFAGNVSKPQLEEFYASKLGSHAGPQVLPIPAIHA